MLATALTLILVLAAVVYLRQWFGSGVPAWRAVTFVIGLFLTWIAAASPLASFDDRMLTGHMVQHLLLMTVAPPLIWLGEPLITMRPRRWKLPNGFGRLPGHPVFCWLAAAAVLVAWHVPAIFRLGMQSPTWHFIEQTSFLTAGLLFWWPVIQPRPTVARWPRWTMLLYLFLATLPCDVLSGLLVFSDRVAYPMYLCTHGKGGLSALEDQQFAAALMWTCVTIVFLVAGTVLSMQMLSRQKGPIPA